MFAVIFGPAKSRVFRLALDTGATDTLLNAQTLSDIGYDLVDVPLISVTTSSGIEQMLAISIARIEALGQNRADLPILGHTLPPSATIDGVLGLDFLRGYKLTVDFRIGQLSLI